jgi:hypothetical protein
MSSNRCPGCGRSFAHREGSTGSHWSGCLPRKDDWTLMMMMMMESWGWVEGWVNGLMSRVMMRKLGAYG